MINCLNLHGSFKLRTYHEFLDFLDFLDFLEFLEFLGFLGLLDFLDFLDFIGFLDILDFLGFLGFLGVTGIAFTFFLSFSSSSLLFLTLDVISSSFLYDIISIRYHSFSFFVVFHLSSIYLDLLYIYIRCVFLAREETRVCVVMCVFLVMCVCVCECFLKLKIRSSEGTHPLIFGAVTGYFYYFNNKNLTRST